jgi:hypothetical protein
MNPTIRLPRSPPTLRISREASCSCVIRLPSTSSSLSSEVQLMIIGRSSRPPHARCYCFLRSLIYPPHMHSNLIGGHSISASLRSCISYIPSLNKWVDMPSLNVPRFRFCVSVWKGCFFLSAPCAADVFLAVHVTHR